MGRTVVALGVSLVAGVWSGAGLRATTSELRSSASLAGGVAALATALGVARPFDRAFAIVEATRLAYDNPPGESVETDSLRRRLLAHVESVRARRGSPEDDVPLPLPPRVWTDSILNRQVRDDDLALAILETREAALVYAGLSSLDDETLTYLGSDQSTLGLIAREHAAAFAAFGGSLRIRDDRVVVPGGDAARELWETAVLEPVTAPGPFVLRLLGADGGRLAFLYDTAAQLDPPAVRYLLGLDLPPAARLAHFDELSQVFATFYPSWKADARPFSRPPLDGVLLFHSLRVQDDGRLAGPFWSSLWTEVFGEGIDAGAATDLPRRFPAAELPAVDPARQIDAAWIAGRVLAPLTLTGRPRFEALLFAQRVFGACTPADVPELARALRGFLTFPALSLSLERLGVRNPAVYARAARRATTIATIVGPGEAAVALTEFQALVAIVEQARRRRTLDQETAQALVESLVAVEPDASRGYHGAMARWLDVTLLPILWRLTGEALESSSAERTVLRAVAGPAAAVSGSRATVEWEGRVYRVDPGSAEFARLAAIRANQPGNDLDQVLAFCRAVAVAPESRERLEGAAAAAVAAARGLQAPVISAAYASVRPPTPQTAAQRALARAQKGDLHGALTDLNALPSQGDALLADALASIVYAMYLGPPDGPALASGNVALRHDFGPSLQRVATGRASSAWLPPREALRGGWHVVGALLGLDIALSRFALRPLNADSMPPMPTLNGNERRTFAESAALMEPFDLADAELPALVQTLERGRRRVEGLLEDPTALDAVARDARLSERRRQALRWALAHDRQSVLASVSRLEWLWLGDPGRAQTGRLDVWGMSAVPLTGCWCSALGAPAAWETFAGRPMNGQLATRLPDLTFRTAEELARLDLPAVLAPGVLSLASNDLIYEAQPAHHDDWLAVVHYVRDLPAERFVDYVSALTAGGPLIAAEGVSRDR